MFNTQMFKRQRNKENPDFLYDIVSTKMTTLHIQIQMKFYVIYICNSIGIALRDDKA